MTVYTLGDIAEWGSGGTPKRSVREYFGEGSPWLSISDLNDDTVFDAKESLTQLGINNSSAKLVPAGTVFVAMYGSIGKLGIAGREMCTSQAIAFARPNPDLVDTRYLYHYLLSQRPNLVARGRGGTQMNIGQKDLKNWPIRLPSLKEQRRIAAALDDANAARKGMQKLRSHLVDLTQSVFQSIFGDPIANERGLPVEPLRQWVSGQRPITYGILKPGPDVPDGVPYVRVADMKNRSIDQAGIKRTSNAIAAEYRRSTVRKGDLLISIRGHVGRFASVPGELDGANITQDSARLSIDDPDFSTYVRAAVEHPSAQAWMARRTRGAAVQGINLGDLKELPLPVPGAREIRQLSDSMRCIDLQYARRSTQSNAMDELFRSLQDRAFRGEL